MVPTIFVFPSLSSMVSPSFTNSGRYLNTNFTSPRSSFRRICSSPYISSSTTVCWIVPQCSTPSYLGLMVVAWWSTCSSASKVVTGSGLSWLSITTIPLRMSLRTSFSLALVALRQRQTSSPAQASLRLTRFTWMDLIATLLKFLSLSGPSRHCLFSATTPVLTIPDTTSPTPSTRKFSLISNSKGCLMASSMVISFCFSRRLMKVVRISKPNLETLEMGKMGQMFPLGMSSVVLRSSCVIRKGTPSVVFSLISRGNLLRSLCLRSFFISSTVSSYLFWGARSILVTMMKKGIFRKRHSPMCSLVIFCSPMFAPTTTHPQSGASPVSPFIVVLRYFSWPQRSTREMILWLWLTTSFQYLFLFWLKRSGTTCLPSLVKPMISWPMEEVLPVCCSWRQLRTLTRAPPLPSSAMPLVRTETRVDFPASTFPMMPILMSFSGRSSSIICGLLYTRNNFEWLDQRLKYKRIGINLILSYPARVNRQLAGLFPVLRWAALQLLSIINFNRQQRQRDELHGELEEEAGRGPDQVGEEGVSGSQPPPQVRGQRAATLHRLQLLPVPQFLQRTVPAHPPVQQVRGGQPGRTHQLRRLIPPLLIFISTYQHITHLIFGCLKIVIIEKVPICP